ncbi:MAG: hypothetical protein ACOX41_09490 [Anaerovoracaceae bacterium]|jgi:epoxyqueuosine reductase
MDEKKITFEELREHLNRYIAEAPGRAIDADYALRPELIGIRYFDEPLIGCADARDPLFEQMKNDPYIYGDFLRLPEEWLPGARTVISVFFPFSAAIRDSNKKDPRLPSGEWLHGRIEGQEFFLAGMRQLRQLLIRRGRQAVIPALDEKFQIREQPEAFTRGMPPVLSNWSERHAAYAAGLGTFGLSKHLITKKGVCGRFSSIITDAAFPVTPRTTGDPFAGCSKCGRCVRRCPVRAIRRPAPQASAIELSQSKDNRICSKYVDYLKEKFAPRYGCGKCQVNVPCERGIPTGDDL